MRHEGRLFTGMFLAAALAPLGSTMIAVTLPSIASELHVTTGALTGALVATYLIAGIAAMSPGGKLGDLIGHRRGLAIGMAVYATGSAAGFLFATLPALAMARIGMAVGGALIVPAAMAILRNSVPENRRARTFGWFGSVMGTAAAIGPLVGGELTSHYGWRSVFVANVPVILVAYALIRSSEPSATPTAPPAGHARFDILGSLLIAGSLTTLVGASRMHGPLVSWAFALGILLLASFVVWERRTPAPVVDLGLFARSAFAAGNAVVALQNLAMYALLFQLPIFFEQVRGVRPGETGRSLIGMMAAMVVGAPLGGRLAERFGARLVVLTGCLASLAGVIVLSNFAALLAPAQALPGLILVGTGLGLATAPSQSIAMSAVEPTRAGMAGGALSTSRYLGGVIGIAVLGRLLEASHGVIPHHGAAVFYEAALTLAALASWMLPGHRAAANTVQRASSLSEAG